MTLLSDRDSKLLHLLLDLKLAAPALSCCKPSQRCCKLLRTRRRTRSCRRSSRSSPTCPPSTTRNNSSRGQSRAPRTGSAGEVALIEDAPARRYTDPKTDPLHPALLASLFFSVGVWIVSEITGNVSQVDRLWTVRCCFCLSSQRDIPSKGADPSSPRRLSRSCIRRTSPSIRGSPARSSTRMRSTTGSSSSLRSSARGALA